MNDMETMISGALHAQAEEALQGAPAHGASDVVDLGDYLGRANARRPRHGLRLALGASVAAATVAALALGVTYVTSRPAHQAAHATVGAAGQLATVGTAPVTPTNPYGLAPGHYLHVHVGATTVGLGGPPVQNGPYDTWIPADPNGAWVYVDSGPSNEQAVSCTAASKAGIGAGVGGVNEPDTADVISACSAASLPADPAALRANFAAFYHGPGRFDSVDDAVWTIANFYLDSGYAPKSVALAVIEVLRGLPGATVTHHVSNGAGQFGDAVAFVQPNMGLGTTSVIYDPATGRVIGTTSYEQRAPQPITYTVTTTAPRISKTAPGADPSASPTN